MRRTMMKMHYPEMRRTKRERMTKRRMKKRKRRT